MRSRIWQLTEKAKNEPEHIVPDDAKQLLEAGRERPFDLFAAATEVREFFKGRTVTLCSIVNAKSGICPENCRFCAQSAHYHTSAPVYPLIRGAEIVAKAREAFSGGARLFSIVTSGTSVVEAEEWDEILDAIRGIRALGMKPCASLGLLDAERARTMREAGLFRYHHNLETSRSFFPHICTTHEYDEDIMTLSTAAAAGLSVCSGGIIGLGETMEQRIELAFTLKELNVDSVPINILNAIPGTPLADTPPLRPMEVLLTISLYRFILPEKDIRLCGGKEKNLRQLLPLAIPAGCNSLMTGNYLTTLGRDSSHDIEMVKDLELSVAVE